MPVTAPGTRYVSAGAAFALADAATGDRGLGPLLAEHPELVLEVAVAEAPGNPDIDTRADLVARLEAAWAERVEANNAQVDRHREVPDGTDFYAPVTGLFRADPTRTDEPVLQELLMLAQPGETWLDIGAGAGRYALPLAMELARSGGSVLAVDPSRGMLDALRATADEHAITNVRIVEGRWPDVAPEAGQADVSLIAHVSYDIAAIGPFLAAMEAAARRVAWPCSWSASRRRSPTCAGRRRGARSGCRCRPCPSSSSSCGRMAGDRWCDARARAAALRLARGARRLPAPTAVGRRRLRGGGALPGRAGPAHRGRCRRWRRARRPAAVAHRRGDLAPAVIEEGTNPADGKPWVQPSDRASWRAWLIANHATSSGVHLVTWRRAAGQPTVDYADAVEEALCVGWVNSKAGKLDADRMTLWFTARRPRSGWSRPNGARRAAHRGRTDAAGRAGRHRGGQATRHVDPPR